MPLTQGQIQEAMGRAGLVYELLEVEARIERAEGTRKHRESQLPLASHLKRPTLEAERDQATEVRDRYLRRMEEIIELLWGEGAKPGEKSWQEEVRELDREQALLAVEQLLRRRPEVTPPDDVDEQKIGWIHNWLVAKIGELPKEERTGWTR